MRDHKSLVTSLNVSLRQMHRTEEACALKVLPTNCQTALRFGFCNLKRKLCRTLKSLEVPIHVMTKKIKKQSSNYRK